MKIIVTGSLGNISKSLTKELIQRGYSVTIISSKAERQKEIEAMGAQADLGTMQDIDFLLLKNLERHLGQMQKKTKGAMSNFSNSHPIIQMREVLI